MGAEENDHFNALPEGCIAYTLSLTSPRDACRLSSVSSTFCSAAQSDDVWESFLPPDYRDILSRSEQGIQLLPLYTSKKQLYLHLCDNPILIDNGTKVHLFFSIMFTLLFFSLTFCFFALECGSGLLCFGEKFWTSQECSFFFFCFNFFL